MCTHMHIWSAMSFYIFPGVYKRYMHVVIITLLAIPWVRWHYEITFFRLLTKKSVHVGCSLWWKCICAILYLLPNTRTSCKIRLSFRVPDDDLLILIQSPNRTWKHVTLTALEYRKLRCPKQIPLFSSFSSSPTRISQLKFWSVKNTEEQYIREYFIDWKCWEVRGTIIEYLIIAYVMNSVRFSVLNRFS